MQIVIADTSCLIVLTKTGHLPWLRALFDEIFITPTVLAEYGAPLPEWVRVRTAQRAADYPEFTTVLGLGAGEASAIALALETPDCEIILDDALARKVAHRAGLAVVGTVGLCLRAKQRGLIDEVGPALHELQAVGLWLSDDVVQLARRLAGE